MPSVASANLASFNFSLYLPSNNCITVVDPVIAKEMSAARAADIVYDKDESYFEVSVSLEIYFK